MDLLVILRGKGTELFKYVDILFGLAAAICNVLRKGMMSFGVYLQKLYILSGSCSSCVHTELTWAGLFT